MFHDYDEGYKIIMVGNASVGKSSLLLRFIDKTFNNNMLSTIGVDFKFKIMDIHSKKVKMEIWDTAGSENFRSIVSAYYRGTDAVVLVFNLNHKPSFIDLYQFWIKEVNKYKEINTQLMLIGNMADKQNVQVNDEQINTFLKQENICLFHKTSAKTGENVVQAFTTLAQTLVLKGKSKSVKSSKGKPLSMSIQEPEQLRRRKCCS